MDMNECGFPSYSYQIRGNTSWVIHITPRFLRLILIRNITNRMLMHTNKVVEYWSPIIKVYLESVVVLCNDIITTFSKELQRDQVLKQVIGKRI